MKILGIIPGRYHNQADAIVQLSSEELNHIIGGSYSSVASRISVGAEVEICQRFSALVALESKAQEARKVGSALRAFAKAVDEVIEESAAAFIPAEKSGDVDASKT